MSKDNTMSITELFPIVKNLSPAEKIRLLEFLKAEIEEGQSALGVM
jgi:hypothetical protein